MENKNYNWDAADYFARLTASNKFAAEHEFAFGRVSSLQGFEEYLQQMQTANAFVLVCDTSDGWTTLTATPHTRRIKTVFLAMRHAAEDMEARAQCMELMRELFRQFMSKFIQEKTRLEENFIYPDDRISFKEIDRYFYAGCACAYFQIAIDTFTDLQFNEDEWN